MGSKIKIIVIIFILFFVHSVFAIPNMMNYRGKLFENSNPVNGMRNFRFRVYDQLTFGNLKWDSGGPFSLDVNNGYYNFTLTIPSNIFTNNNLYLDVEVNGSSLTPREQLVSAGYSYNADMVDGMHATNLNYWKANNMTNIYHTRGTVGIGGLSLGPEKFHVYGDSALEGDLYLFNRYINDVYALTIQPDDAAQTGLRFGSSGTFVDYTFNDSPAKTLLFQNNNKLGMSINSNGYIGIGLSAPLYRLDINGTNSMTGFRMIPNAALGRVLTSDVSGFGTWQNLPAGLGGQGTSGFISRFKSSMELTNSTIYQDSTGRIGIGTTSLYPNTRFHVNQVIGGAFHKYGLVSTISNAGMNDMDTVAILGFANGYATSTYGFPVGVMGIANPVTGYTRGYGVYAGLGQSIPITSAGVECALFANASNYGPSGIFLNGNVGIGTINPQQQLEITGSFRLPVNTTSNVGVIYSGTSRLIHGRLIGNLFFGLNAGNFTYSGTYNMGFGAEALYNLISGLHNMGFGYRSFYYNTTGSYNVGLGNYSGHYFSGDYNTFLGFYSGYGNASGSTGDYNTAAGYYAGRVLYTGAMNAIFGAYAGNSMSAGSGNTLVGYSAGRNITSGSSNVIIGQQAGNNLTTGSGNIFLGYFAGYNETGSGKLYIDNSPTTAPLIWGDFNNDIVNINGNLGVGTNNPDSHVEISGAGLQILKISSVSGTKEAGIILERTSAGSYDWRMLDTGGNLYFGYSGDDGLNWTDTIQMRFQSPFGLIALNGDLDANKFKFNVPKTNVIKIPAASFSSRTPGTYEATFNPWGYLYPTAGAAGSTADFIGTVVLPNGAIIRDVRAYVYDNDGTGTYYWSSYYLYRSVCAAGASVAPVAVASSTTTTADSVNIQEINLTVNASYNTVDNDGYMYFLYFSCNHQNIGSIRLYGAKITYTVTEAD